MKASYRGIIGATAPGILMLGLFYSLAVHMYRSFGGWPASIGERGFPPLLLVHAKITEYVFMTLLVSSFFLVPIAIAVCSSAPYSKRYIPYSVSFAAMFFICWGMMQFAPEPFLYWWRD